MFDSSQLTPNEKRCPRCGRSYPVETQVCPDCKVLLVASNIPLSSGKQELKIHISAILRDALAQSKAEEDFDETLLRVLKARYPEQAIMLLTAFSRVIETNAQQIGGDRRQAIERLAKADPGPEINFRSSSSETGNSVIKSVVKTEVFRIGDKQFGSINEVPAEFRRMIEEARGRGGNTPLTSDRQPARTGCLSMILGGWLIALLFGGRR